MLENKRKLKDKLVFLIVFLVAERTVEEAMNGVVRRFGPSTMVPGGSNLATRQSYSNYSLAH